MSRFKIFIYISVVFIIIAFGQYQKSQLKTKVEPTQTPLKEEVTSLPTITTTAPEAEEIVDAPPPQDEPKEEVQEVTEQAETNRPVEMNIPQREIVNTPPPVIANNFATKPEVIAQPSNNVIETYTPPVPKVVKLPEIELFMPEKSNLTKEEKIAEIRNLVTIFNAHLVELYKDKKISYIPGDHKVEVLLGDSIEYYEDPVAFEKKSTNSFIQTTMQFIDDVQRLRKQAHQRYLNKNR